MKCPLKFKEFTEPTMQECDEKCAWLILDMEMGIPYHTGHCAVAVIARELMCDKPLGTNFMPVYEEEVDK